MPPWNHPGHELPAAPLIITAGGGGKVVELPGQSRWRGVSAGGQLAIGELQIVPELRRERVTQEEQRRRPEERESGRGQQEQRYRQVEAPAGRGDRGRRGEGGDRGHERAASGPAGQL